MTRLQATGVNAAQIERWNGELGNRWAEDTFRERQDRAQGPFGEAAMDALGLQPGQHVLDIGCGSGSTTFALANRVGPSGRAVGVDISAPQLENAKRRAATLVNPIVEFHNQDVSIFPFETGTFDRAFSRFGVMFFARSVDAFVNIRCGMKPGGRIAFVCWQSPERNPGDRKFKRHFIAAPCGSRSRKTPLEPFNAARLRSLPARGAGGSPST